MTSFSGKNMSTNTDATTALSCAEGHWVSISVIPTGFTGSIELQRQFGDAGGDWRKIKAYTGQAEDFYYVETDMSLRLAMVTVSAGSAIGELRLGRTKVRG